MPNSLFILVLFFASFPYRSVTVYAGNSPKLKMMDDVMMDGDIVACPDAVE